MGKSRVEAAQTRERIVETASTVFRQNGIHQTGIAELMSAAGLTHGGFYKHFASKDELIAEASALALRQAEQRLAPGEDGAPADLEALAWTYLRLEDAAHAGGGCLFAAVGSELARAAPATRQAASEGFERLVQVFARRMGAVPAPEATRRARIALSIMIGALTMSRIVTDPGVARALLDDAVEAVKQLA